MDYFDEENQKQSFGINKKIKKAFDLNGFRWKQLVNDKLTGKRSTAFAIRRGDRPFNAQQS